MLKSTSMKMKKRTRKLFVRALLCPLLRYKNDLMSAAAQAARQILPLPAHMMARKKNNSLNEYPHGHCTLGSPEIKSGMPMSTATTGTPTSSLLKCTLSSNDGKMSLRHSRLIVTTLPYNMEIPGALANKLLTTLQQVIGITYPGQISSKRCCIDNRQPTNVPHWPPFCAWWTSRRELKGPAEEATDIVWITATDQLDTIPYYWTGPLLLSIARWMFPSCHIALIDNDCVPLALFEMQDLLKLSHRVALIA